MLLLFMLLILALFPTKALLQTRHMSYYQRRKIKIDREISDSHPNKNQI